jgi:tRNA-dihydrouridine synthase
MRLGWDDAQRNAPALARRAQASGVALVTVHGRTRCQFYKGKADWHAIAEVRAAITIPLIANGDLTSFDRARSMLAASGADGLMMGRGAYGRPWAPGVLANALDPGSGRTMPSLAEQREIVLGHFESMLSHYGAELGGRIARKHLGWYVEDLKDRELLEAEQARAWRTALVTRTRADDVRQEINRLYDAVAELSLEAAA